MNEAFRQFGEWKSRNKIATTQARFTCSRIGRHSRQDYPCLQAKGIAGKRISYWLAEVAKQHAEKAGASEIDRLVSVTATSYCKFLDLIGEFSLALTPQQSEKIFKAGHLHLLSYAKLRTWSSGIRGAHSAGRSLFQLAPKHHYFLHVLHTVRETKVNCRFYTLMAAEGFVGVVARIARMCHRASVSKRVLQRYKTKFAAELRCHLRTKRG